MIEIIDIDEPHPYPPRVSEFTRPFWDGLAQGRFLTTASASTGRLTFPPKLIAPDTWADDMEWIELSGNGVIYSHTTVHAGPRVFTGQLPYMVCIVDLDEGLRLATRYLGGQAEIGQRVRIAALRYTNHVSFAAKERALGTP
jgi:uncharacterized protein